MMVLSDKGYLTGLEYKWTFDEGYTAMALEDFKKNPDGTYDSKQLAELAKVNIDGLKGVWLLHLLAAGRTGGWMVW